MSPTLGLVFSGFFLCVGAVCATLTWLTPVRSARKTLAIPAIAGFASAGMCFFMPAMAFAVSVFWLAFTLDKSRAYKSNIGKFILGTALVLSCLPTMGIAVAYIPMWSILTTWILLMIVAFFGELFSSLKGMRW
jgi:hypothetical protein